ncbi:MAG TPA: class I SAM-dependent methyltransferase [Nitrolancea sp.]|nr:class I SAM-dependent methyltransferase [Nitrolancea sp.]
MTVNPADNWGVGDAYEPYVGRWSRLVMRDLLDWMSPASNLQWLDVGCGTGALSSVILERAAPRRVVGIDGAKGFVAYARAHQPDTRARFVNADARALPFPDDIFDALVAGLMLNFVPQPSLAAQEMARVTRPGGVVAVYVWDYAGEMQMMKRFWDAAMELDANIAHLDEGARFPLCQPEPLAALFQSAGLQSVEVRAIDIPTHFQDFDDYWSPFLGGQGSAPSYVATLSKPQRDRLRDRLRDTLPTAPDGSIDLIARAWAVRGIAPR